MKQVIVVRMDLGMSAGKIAAQACHACLGAYKKANKSVKSEWESGGAKKVVLGCESLKELKDLQARAKSKRLITYLVKDAGHTEVSAGTLTSLGIGPAKEAVINQVTGELSLLK